MAHGCSRGVVTPPALRDLVWWPRGGEVLLARVSRCCRETAIPPCTPSLGNDPRRSFAPSSRPRCDDGSTHDRSPLAPASIAIPSRRNFGRCQCRRVMAPVWGGTSRRCGSMLARRWRPSEHRRFLALIPRGDPHVPSDWRRDDAVTGGPRATDRDASPDEFWSGGGASRRFDSAGGWVLANELPLAKLDSVLPGPVPSCISPAPHGTTELQPAPVSWR